MINSRCHHKLSKRLVAK